MGVLATFGFIRILWFSFHQRIKKIMSFVFFYRDENVVTHI